MQGCTCAYWRWERKWSGISLPVQKREGLIGKFSPGYATFEAAKRYVMAQGVTLHEH